MKKPFAPPRVEYIECTPRDPVAAFIPALSDLLDNELDSNQFEEE